MKTIANKFICAMAVIASLMIYSCADDFPYAFDDIPEGEGSLSATMTFTPTLGAELAATRTPGNIIQTINSLCVLVYTPVADEVKLVKKYYKDGTHDDFIKYETSTYYVDQEKDFFDGNQAHTDETKTAQATFTIPDLSYGRYKIYAVANMGDLSKYEDKIQTETGLRDIHLEWDYDDVTKNNQMFGYFTPSGAMNSKGFDAPVITFSNNKTTNIHAWLKRAASKVTIAYDPSGLNQDVTIYIKNVTIRDIPKECLLGNENIPAKVNDLYNHLDNKSNDEWNEDHTEYYGPDYTKPSAVNIPNTRFYYDSNGIIMDNTNPNNPQPITTEEGLPADVQTAMEEKTYGLVLANGSREAIPKGAHSPTAQSLFFYENNQGVHPNCDKKPNKNEVGKPIRVEETVDGVLNDYKDQVPLGTYIEVEAYYVSSNPQKVGEGSIKYRFMLGKDIHNDYNAQRNYHFKLTLGFNGWANEPDWHIDYVQPEPGLEVPPVFRVSYLYHQVSQLPIRILGNCTKLTVTIEENNWAPYDPDSSDYVPPAGITDTDPYPLYAFQWNREAYFKSAYWDGEKENCAFGFLSLHLEDIYKTTLIEEDYSADSNDKLIDYYNRKYDGTNSEGYREFVGADLVLTDQEESREYPVGKHDSYQIQHVYDDRGKPLPNQKTLLLPVWTRAKSLIRDSGFSGNNPYEGFERKAVLKIYAEFDDESNTTEYVTVLQVKRLVNPKGVWRDRGRNEPFNVTLLEAENANGMSNFQPFISEGEWSAFIEGNQAGFTLSKHPEYPDVCYQSPDGVIHGYTNKEIHFTINFEGVHDDADSPCAIVKVLYHGNQCVHKILVRKGYDTPIFMGGKTWSTYSLYKATRRGNTDTYDAVLTKNPLMLGSMFRRGRLESGILVKNNMEIGFLQPPGQNCQFMVANDKTPLQTWSQIGYDTDNTKSLGTFITTDEYGQETTYRVPTYEDWQALTNEVEFGFGVVYGSAALAPQPKAEDAYGLIDPDNTGEFTDPRGMRGIIAYVKDTGNQIFFPMGKYGTGRRTMFNLQRRPTADGSSQADPNYYGVLRYADVYSPLTIAASSNNLYRPIPYNLPITSGNIYWIDKLKYGGGPQGSNCLGWDLNYFNFDFNAYTSNNYQDACPIKLIVVNQPGGN